MTKFTFNKIIAAGAVALSLTSVSSATAMVQGTPLPQMAATVPGMPSDDSLLLSRRGRGADDPAGHIRGGKGRGKDDAKGHTSLTAPEQEQEFARRGRGADDPKGHVRGGKGKDDPVGHG